MNLHCPTTSQPRVLLALERLEPRIVAGVRRFAEEAAWILEAPSAYQDLLPRLRDWRGDGVIANPSNSLPVAPLTQMIRQRRVPAVSLQSEGAFLGAARVLPDFESIGEVGAEHLIWQGYEEIALVSFSGDETEASLWRGLKRACQFAGARARKISLGDLEVWLRSRRAPIGLLAPTDRKASTVLATCVSNGLRVPYDVGVLGVGNEGRVCGLAKVALSSVACRYEQIGYEAARSLAALMRGERPELETREMGAGPVVGRGSAEREGAVSLDGLSPRSERLSSGRKEQEAATA